MTSEQPSVVFAICRHLMYVSRFLCLSFTAFTISAGVEAQTFTDRTNLLSDTTVFSGVAMGVVDMNGDGLDDIVRLDNASNLSIEYQQTPNGAFGNYLYGNLGPGDEWSLCVGDVDHNGFNDLIAGGAYNEIKLLTANATGTSYSSSNLPGGTIFLQGSNFADINNDGWLDIFACHDDDDSHSYRNLGNGTFVYDPGLIDTSMASGNSGNYGSVWMDYDNDGDLDMYLSKCRQGVNNSNDPRRINRLFQNDGNNSYTDVGPAAGMDMGDQTWASDFADIDNDGDMDCFMVNHFTSSLLMENNGDGTFTDITSTSGMSADDLDLFGIQCLFRDFDNDGFVDLLVAGTEHRLFRNNGNGTFTRLTNPFNSNEMESFGVGDLNSDGYLDIYAGYAELFNSPSTIPDVLFMNDGGSNNYFCVTLQGTTSNLNGVGARLELHGSWGMQIREVRAGESYGIMNSLKQHFGIGTATSIAKLVVRWPSGTVDVVNNPAINQMFVMVEGSSPATTDPQESKLLDGLIVGGQLSDVFESDDVYLELDPSPTKNPLKQKIDIILSSQSPVATPSNFAFRVEAAMKGGPSGDVIQTIELFDNDSGDWEVVDTRPATNADSVVNAEGSGDLSRFVHPKTGEIFAKVKWESTSFSGSPFNWSIDVDQAIWMIE